MAKIYYEKLSVLISKFDLDNELSNHIEVKHFFGGAALYIDKTLCVSWSPVGLAFKLPEKNVNRLINSGKTIPLQYFSKGHIKKGYAFFENPESIKVIFC